MQNEAKADAAIVNFPEELLHVCHGASVTLCTPSRLKVFTTHSSPAQDADVSKYPFHSDAWRKSWWIWWGCPKTAPIVNRFAGCQPLYAFQSVIQQPSEHSRTTEWPYLGSLLVVLF